MLVISWNYAEWTTAAAAATAIIFRACSPPVLTHTHLHSHRLRWSEWNLQRTIEVDTLVGMFLMH